MATVGDEQRALEVEVEVEAEAEDVGLEREERVYLDTAWEQAGRICIQELEENKKGGGAQG